MGSEYGGIHHSKVVESTTTPYEDQKPGTSGLRKQTRVFMQPNYVANFAQSVFDCLPEREKVGGTLLVSGDGRFYTTEALREICSVAAGNGVGRVWIGQHGLSSTPACSAIIRERENGVCFGGFILTASHNPGGIDQDFGIKYNTANGAPAQESLMDAAFKTSKSIRRVRRVNLPPFSLDKIGIAYDLKNEFMIEVIDPIEDWLRVMHRCFDFNALRRLFSLPSFSFVYDAMHGVSGPYAKRLFVEDLKAKPSCLMRADPKPDFGGGHPDPNLTYAKDLVALMKVFTPEEADQNTPLFGAAGDGDCDRNMILGRGIFVTPSDSVAIIALYAERCIPYFSGAETSTSLPSAAAGGSGGGAGGSGGDGEGAGGGGGSMKGFARSMPTSQALDLVAKKLGKDIYETPTGWKYFANLMDSGRISICGEESFGTGSVHVREKDGLWAVLAWLTILAYRNGCCGSSQTTSSTTATTATTASSSNNSSSKQDAAAAMGGTAGGEEGKGLEGSGSATEKESHGDKGHKETKQEEKEEKEGGDTKIVTVEQIVHEFWEQFGRIFYCRYDFENKESEAAHRMMSELEDVATKYGENCEQLLKSPAAAAVEKELLTELPLEKMDVFEYEDPVDGQVARHQGIRLFLRGGGRIVWRLSGTGSSGATIRIYMERLETDKTKILRDAKETLQSTVALALQFCRIKEIVGTDTPSVIT